MKNSYSLIALLICLVLLSGIPHAGYTQSSTSGSSQFWMDQMQDPNVDFWQLQHAFHQYWKDKDSTQKGTTFKVFKRWEYINENRVMPDGKLPAPDYVKNQFEKYMAELDGPSSAGGSWSFVGMNTYPINNTAQPTGMGRINAIAFHPTNSNLIYVGAPSGGLWKTTSPNGNSTTWTNLCNNLPTLGVSSIAINPIDPNIIYIGTGDRDGGDAPGIGVYKTTDGGSTWTQVSAGMGNVTVGAMVMHPTEPNTLLAATSSGIFKTTNGGASWTLKQAGNFKDIKFKPGDPSVVYAVRIVTPSEFYRSSDNGNSWTNITTIPTSGIGSRMVIGVSPANAQYVYLVQCKSDNTFSNLLRSTDSGLNFSTMAATPPNLLGYECNGTDASTQATYDLCIAVDPTNANVVFVGGINTWKTTNGGASWAISTHWSSTCSGTSVPVHADHHVFEWAPDNTTLYLGHDGGITYTPNKGTSWTEITGALPITQIYKIGQGVSNVNYTLFGCQDNGCNGTTNGTTFYTTSGGDGGESVIDYANSNYCYNTYVSGSIRRSTTGPLGLYTQIAANGVNGIDETGAWISPYFLDRVTHTTMFAGFKNVWRSNNITSSPPTFTKISSGETDVCKVMEQSPVNVNIVYVSRQNTLKRTDNANAAAGSVTWTSCALPGGTTPSDIKAHPTDENIVYATAGQKVYKSTDKGASWTDISSNLPALPINCLVLDKNGNEAIYIGNETSIWFKNASMTNWMLYSNGLPPVDVRELEIYYDAVASNNRIKAGTYGRGLWQSDLATVNVLDPTNFNATPISSNQINLSWTKNAANNNVIIAYGLTSTFGSPVDGTAYSIGNVLSGGGEIVYSGSLSAYSHASLTSGTTYYYKIWSVNGSNQYSAGLPPINATTYSHAWTASAGTSDWFTPGNWGPNSVPTASDNVYIPAGPAFMPQINAGGAACTNIIIENGASLTMSASAAYTLSVGGDWTNNGTFTRGIGTVDFNGSNALQQIKGSSATNFYTLSVSKGSASKSLEATAQITTSNYLLINSGTFKLDNPLSSVTIGSSSGDRTISSSKGIWLNSGTFSSTGSLYSWGGNIRVSGGTLDLNNRTLEYGYDGNIVIEGGIVKVIRLAPNSTGLSVKYTQTGGEFIVAASSSTSTSYAPFDLTSASSFTMSGGTITVQRTSSFTSEYNNLATTQSVTGGTLQIGNSSTGTSQTIRINSTVPVYNLVVNATNNPVAQLVTNGLNVMNTVTISGGTLNANSLNLSVGGNWTNNGTFTPGSGTVSFNGTALQNLAGNAATTFNNLTLDNSNGISLSGSVNATVNGTLTLTSGVVSTGNNKVVIGSAGSVSRTSGHIFGNLQKYLVTGSNITKNFEIGDASAGNYTPVSVSFASVGTAGNLIAKTTSGDHPNIAGSTLISSKSVNRYWTLTNSGVGFSTCDAVFNFLTGDVDAGASTSNLVCGKFTSPTWSYPSVGSQNSNSTQITGLTSFSDFQLAEALPPQIDWANLQWPGSGNTIVGNSFMVYAQVYEPGITNTSGQGAGISAWIGYSTSNTDPSTWSDWMPATYIGDIGNNDEYMADIGSVIAAPGTYYYASRFKLGSADYVYGGFQGGFWNGTSNINGTLTVNPSPQLDWVNLQYPATTTIAIGSSVTIYAQVYEPGVTPGAGQGSDISAWIGYSTVNDDPATGSGWTWVEAAYNNSVTGNNDEYMASIGTSLPVGTYYYASRFKYGLADYVYGGLSGFWSAGTSGILNVVTPTFSGNGNWNEPERWNTGVVPLVSDNTIVNGTCLVNGIHTTHDLVINSGHSLTIASSGRFTANGLLTNNAGISGLIVESGGSLIENSGVNATVNRIISPNEWHFISSPVESATATIFYNLFLQKFNETTNSYTYILEATTPLIPASGYAIYNDAGQVTTSFSGPLNTGSLNTPVAKTNLGWNLVGNPYPSYIDWNATGWTKTNVNGTIYIHKNDASWATWNGIVGTNDGTRYIAPCQGFMVEASGTGTLGMTNDVRTNNSAPFFKNSGDYVPNLVRLEVSGNGYKDETVIYLTPEATFGFDRASDAHKLFGDVPEAAQIFSLGPVPLSINTLRELAPIPVGIKAVTGNYTIAATEINDLFDVKLEDIKTGKVTNLHTNPYTFNVSQDGTENRFMLHFAALGTTEPSSKITNVYSWENEVIVSMPTPIRGDIYIYNTAGQQVTSLPSASGQVRIHIQSGGFYLVKVVTDKQTITEKVWIKY